MFLILERDNLRACDIIERCGDMYNGIKLAKRRYPALEIVTSKDVRERYLGFRKEIFNNKQHMFIAT